MELQVGVKILLKNKEGKFLFMQRNLEKYPELNKQWDIPGGRINPGTSLIDNLKREVMEETGLEIEDEPKLITTQDIFKKDKHIVRLTYVGSAEGAVKLSDEHSEFRWLALSDIEKLDIVDKYLKETIEKFGLR